MTNRIFTFSAHDVLHNFQNSTKRTGTAKLSTTETANFQRGVWFSKGNKECVVVFLSFVLSSCLVRLCRLVLLGFVKWLFRFFVTIFFSFQGWTIIRPYWPSCLFLHILFLCYFDVSWCLCILYMEIKIELNWIDCMKCFKVRENNHITLTHVKKHQKLWDID